MTAYIIFFLIIFLLIFIDYALKTKGVGGFTYCAIFLTIIFSVMRFEVGYDYCNYVGLVSLPPSLLLKRGLEVGFALITWIIQFFKADSFWLFFIYGVLTIIYTYKGICRYTNNRRLAFLIFLLIPGLFLNSFSIIRQSLAVALVFNSIFYLQENKTRQFWYYIIAASIFHYSALLILPFIYIAHKFQSYVKTFAIIGIPISIALSQLNVIGFVFGILLGNSKYAAYLEFEDSGTQIIKIFLLNITLIPYLFLGKYFNKKNREHLFLLLCGIMITNVFASVGAITRMSYYFRIFEIVLLSNTLNYIKKGYSRILYVAIVLLYFTAMFFYSLSNDYYNVNKHPKMTPYKTIFTKIT